MAGPSNPTVTPELRSLAARQWHDYRQRTPGTYFSESQAALDLDQAYAVQIDVARLRCEAGDAVAGYKVGCIGPGVVEQFGMSGPIHARLFRSELRTSGEALDHSAFANLAIEGEMAVRIGAGGTIAAAFPVIELHHFIFRGSPKTLAELVANNGINAGAVLADDDVAAPLDHWQASRTLTVAVNGKAIDSGALWAMAGGAVEAVDWLRNDLRRHSLSLSPGDLVLTGTPLGLHPVRPGDKVTVSVDGRDLVTCLITDTLKAPASVRQRSASE
jgi:2-keto-4-pentenoate hydratase